MRLPASSLVLLLVAAAIACSGSPSGDPSARAALLAKIEATEDLVIGHVFTEFMPDSRLVEAARALCDLHDRVGVEDASQETDSLLRSLDWNAPANSAMLDLMLKVGRTTVCRDTTTAAPLADLLPPRPPFATSADVAEIDQTIATFLETDEGQRFIATIRDREATLVAVFTTTMTDEELVSQARGVCQTWAELGSEADAELRRTQESYGWTGETDAAMFELLLDSADAVCITVGA